MYGGLFGDLPAAKTDGKKLGESESSTNDAAKILAPPDSMGTSAAAAALAQPTPSAFLPRFVPPQAARKGRQHQVKQTFRKRASETSADLQSAPPGVTAALHGSNNDQIAEINSATDAIKTKEQSENDLSEEFYSRKVEASKVETRENALSSNFADSVEESSDLFVESMPPQEPEQLRLLHERAKNQDPYDPLLPNDLLQYWEYRSLAVERERLFQEQQASMREKEELLQQLARERQQLEEAGDYDKVVEHQLQQRGRMTGLGRGLSNLPAWLVEKQRKEAQERQQQRQQQQQEPQM